MKASTTAALLACAASQAQAFSDTSPFILFSTAKCVHPLSHPALPPMHHPSHPPSQSPQDRRTNPPPNRLAAPFPAPANLQTATDVLTTAQSLLASCPTTRYILVSQPNLHAADIRDATGSCRLTPNLCHAVRGLGGADSEGAGGGGGHVWSVAEVVGQVSGRPLREFVEGACRREGVEAVVERVELRHLPAVGSGEEGRGEVVGDNGMLCSLGWR